MSDFKLFYLVSRIRYPNYHPLWLLVYMYLKYLSVAKRKTVYQSQTVCEETFWEVVDYFQDVHNSILVHPSHIYPTDKVLHLYHIASGRIRQVFIVADPRCKANTIYMTTFLRHNFEAGEFMLQKWERSEIFADEVHVAHVKVPNSPEYPLNDILQSYFSLPKIIKTDDLLCVNIKHFSPSTYYQYISVDSLYVKCIKVIKNQKLVNEAQFCSVEKSTLKQVTDIQSYLPKSTSTRLDSLPICPNGLENYKSSIVQAIKPFLTTKTERLHPVFLVEGAEGCGVRETLQSVALELGMHLQEVHPNRDLSEGDLAAHQESRLNILSMTTKYHSPTILVVYEFEKLCKNPEQNIDERLVEYFCGKFLDQLFANNNYPVVLICCTNSNEIHGQLLRVFLEVFQLTAPDVEDRTKMLKWLCQKHRIESCNLDRIANKSHGFHFGDLEALLQYAMRETTIRNDSVVFENDFDVALDLMQSKYNFTIGAPRVPKVEWTDIGGLTNVKEEIVKTIELPLKHPEFFEKSGLSRSGILLFGPPGTGKTLLAKAVANECSLSFLAVKGPELLNMFVGESERNVRNVFQKARDASPCIIFFDELDSLAPSRGHSGDSTGVADRVVAQLLVEMDGLESTGKVFVVAATNRPDLLDPALLRPGRFDKLLYVGPCEDTEGKMAVLKTLTKKFNLSENVEIDQIAKLCPLNLTGADFYGICATAWSSASTRLITRINNGQNADDYISSDIVVEMSDFIQSIKNIKPSVTEADLEYFKNLQQELAK